MHDLTQFQRDALIALAGLEPTKGLAIKEELDDYYEQEVNHGRLYPNLDHLVKAGLVEKGKIDDRTNRYEITEHGRQVIRDRREWEDSYLQDGEEDE